MLERRQDIEGRSLSRLAIRGGGPIQHSRTIPCSVGFNKDAATDLGVVDIVLNSLSGSRAIPYAEYRATSLPSRAFR